MGRYWDWSFWPAGMRGPDGGIRIEVHGPEGTDNDKPLREFIPIWRRPPTREEEERQQQRIEADRLAEERKRNESWIAAFLGGLRDVAVDAVSSATDGIAYLLGVAFSWGARVTAMIAGEEPLDLDFLVQRIGRMDWARLSTLERVAVKRLAAFIAGFDDPGGRALAMGIIDSPRQFAQLIAEAVDGDPAAAAKLVGFAAELAARRGLRRRASGPPDAPRGTARSRGLGEGRSPGRRRRGKRSDGKQRVRYGKTISTADGRTIQNKGWGYRGKKIEATGVVYDRHGFPDFGKSIKHTMILPKGKIIGSRPSHKTAALAHLKAQVEKNRAKWVKKLGEKDVKRIVKNKQPKNYIWHHHQRKGHMQLVAKEVHEATTHTGGHSIWGIG